METSLPVAKPSPLSTRARRYTRVLVAVVSMCIATTVHAARVEIVLDASGSMRGAAGDVSKMEAAKQAVRTTVEAIDAGSSVALRLYGHRLPAEPKEPSCNDTEQAIPFGPLDRARFVAAVEAAQPLGQTPLAHALEQAAADFGELGDEAAVVILVSDGEETCDGDPAAVACAFAERGLALTVHTVGFDVGEVARRQLQAVARCTGGEYRDAGDAAALAQSLQQLTQAGLLVEKDSTYGREIRGGDTYDQAVAIDPGTEYRLDHHQRKNQYDYFAVEAKGGQKLVATIQTVEKGVVVREDDFRENEHPYGGIEVHAPDRKKIANAVVIGKPNGQNSIEVPTSRERSGRFFVLVGNAFQDQHKDARFKVELVDQFDAGSGQDAPEDDEEAVRIAPGEHEGWLNANDQVDWYVFEPDPAMAYEVRVRPAHDEKRVRVTVTDLDGVELAKADAPNPGAAVRLRDLRFPDGGEGYIKVETHPVLTAGRKIETTYSLQMTPKPPTP